MQEVKEEIYSVREIEWLESGMWDFRIESGVSEYACFTGTYEEYIEFYNKYQY